jgi:tripartite-type tricarboxylate transporter receptor subunit TctC
MNHRLSRRRSLLALGAACAASPVLLPSGARAQTTLPDKGLTILVGFAPGGGADAMARAIAPRLERRIGRRVVVENRPGNVAAIPGEMLVKGPKDGTLVAFLASTTLAAKLVVSDFPFDPLADIAPITIVGTSQTGLAVSPKIGVAKFDEYVEWLKSGDDDRRRVGCTSSTLFVDVFAQLIGREINVKLETVAYRGASSLVADLQSGRLSAAVTAVTSFLEHHRGGRVRLLLTTGRTRSPMTPNVPTSVELGYPNLDVVEWFGFFASSLTPTPMIAEWNRHLRAVLDDREAKAQLMQLGLGVDPTTPEDAKARVAAYMQDWKKRLELVGMGPTN